MTRKILAVVAVVVLVGMVGGRIRHVIAQSGTTPVQQSAQMLNAATKVADCNAAVNNTCTATATPAAGNYVYVVGFDIAVCGDATGTVQTNVTWTTTGLTGAPIAWAYSTAINPNACLYKAFNYAQPIKSTSPGAAVTLVSPAVALHTAYNANIYWYEAP